MARSQGGGRTQPVRVPTGGAYGSAQASQTQQKGAPLQDKRAPAPALPSSPLAVPQQGVFGATERPNESPMAGIPQDVAPPPQATTLQLLQVMYRNFPSPVIADLIQQALEEANG